MHPTQYLLTQQHRQEHPYHPHQSSLLPFTASSPSSPSPSPVSTPGVPPVHPILHFQSLFASMELYTQQASFSRRPLSLTREESDRAQSKNETASTEENPSSSDMDDVLLLDVMQATDPTYSRFDTLISLENETTAARHQDSAGLLSALSAEQLEQSAMALDEIPVSHISSCMTFLYWT